MNEPQKEQTAEQHGDGYPKMNVGEHDRHAVPRRIRSAVLLHPDSSEAPERRTPGGFAAHDTIEKMEILLRERIISCGASRGAWYTKLQNLFLVCESGSVLTRHSC